MADHPIASILNDLQNISLDDSYLEEGARVLLRAAPGSDIFLDGSIGTHSVLDVQQNEDTKFEVMLVKHTELDIKFRICMQHSNHNESLCDVYFDPANDCLTVKNTSQASIKILPLDVTGQPKQSEQTLRRSSSRMVMSELCRLTFVESHSIYIRILARIRPRLCSGKVEILEKSGPSKRERSATQEEFVPIKQRITSSGGKALIEPVQQQVQSTSQDRSLVHPIYLTAGQVLEMPRDLSGGMCQIKVIKQLASSRLSVLYLAEHSGLEGVVVVKVLKPALESFRDRTSSTVIQAETWLQEYRTQQKLNHNSIVKMLGGDARYFTLYLEHVAGNDLSTSRVWKAPDDRFAGTKDDVMRIWEDISGALEYLHGQSLQHNDIKPANILYSAARGAVLCDFGLCSEARSAGLMTGGTPFYVPPEFLHQQERYLPADMWAFGVVMLYLFRYIPLPDARGAVRDDVRKLYWYINEVHQRDGSTSSAKITMQTWIDELRAVIEDLDEKDVLVLILKDMLTLQPNQRITPSELRKRVRHEIWCAKRYKRTNTIKDAQPPRPKTQTKTRVTDHELGSTTEENTSFEGDD